MERMLNALETADFVYSDAEIVSFEEKEDMRIPTSRYLLRIPLTWMK